MSISNADHDRQRPLRIELMFTRIERTDDPYALPSDLQRYTYRSDSGTSSRVTFNWGDDEFKRDFRDFESDDCSAGVAQRLGYRLQRMLKGTDWQWHHKRIIDATTPGNARQVHLIIRSDAAEIYTLPWELLVLKTGERLSELPSVLVCRAWYGRRIVPRASTLSAGETGFVATSAARGRILLAWSDSEGAVPHNKHREIFERLSASAQSPWDGFVADRDEVCQVSLERLRDALRKSQDNAPVSVLHLLCHGAGGQKDSETFGVCLYDDEESGRDRWKKVVYADSLRELLVPHAPHLRLVVLAACYSGNNGTLGNNLGSVAQALHRAGIETVIALRTSQSIEGASQFAHAFYSALVARTGGVEYAFLKARTSIASSTDRLSLQFYGDPTPLANAEAITAQPSRPTPNNAINHSATLVSNRLSFRSSVRALFLVLVALSLVIAVWMISRASKTSIPLDSSSSLVSSSTSTPLIDVFLVGESPSEVEHPGSLLCHALDAYPNKLFLHNQNKILSEVSCRSSISPQAGLHRASVIDDNAALALSVTVLPDGSSQIRFRRELQHWLGVESIEVALRTEAHRERIVPILYASAQVVVDRADSNWAGCPSLPSGPLDHIGLLALAARQRIIGCSGRNPLPKPDRIRAICLKDSASGACALARLLYVELYPGAADAVSELRRIREHSPLVHSLYIAQLKLIEQNCHDGRLMTAARVAKDYMEDTDLQPPQAKACMRAQLAARVSCIQKHVLMSERLASMPNWPVELEELQSAFIDNVNRCPDKELRAKAIDERGWWRGRAGDWRSAANDFERAFALIKKSSYRLHAAEAWLQLNEPQRARGYLEENAGTPRQRVLHALLEWIAERQRPAVFAKASAKRLADVYESACKNEEADCPLPDDFQLRALACPQDNQEPCIYDVLTLQPNEQTIKEIRRLLEL